MKCIVVDDEPLARQGLELMIQDVDFLEYKGSFSNAVTADKFMQANAVDLVFLDINMPLLSGMEYLRNVASDSQFIITTAYPDHALDGYELNVTDYLLKPIKFNRFYKAENKALKHQQPGTTPIQEVEVYEDCVFVRTDKKFVRVTLSAIQYIEGYKDYVMIYMEGEKVMAGVNLRTIFSRLHPGNFLRVNKSFIINLLKIKYIDNDFVYVDNTQIPIGDSYRADLLDYVRKTGVIKR